MGSDPERSHVQTEVQRLNAGVYRWVVRTLVVVLVMFALALALLTISPAADQAGVPAKAYFERGTPQAAIEVARRRLGDENVVIFDR